MQHSRSSQSESVIERAASFSRCRRYRYALWRRWSPGPYVMFICLNPSTADERMDDPTVRRCIGFARRWGFGALCMVNLFAFRATNPKTMKSADVDPIGPNNNRVLKRLALGAGMKIAAWGTHGTHLARDQVVRSMLDDLHYLSLTRDGHPRHPLFTRSTLNPVSWT
eukprot:355746-Chlamydomonas_euryale.AAC.2